MVLRPSPFFLSLPSNAFPDIGSVGRIETKNLKKNNKKSRNSRPWYPRMTLKVNIHIFGLTKCTIYCEKCSCFCPCFSLCCYYAHFSDWKKKFQVKNSVTTSLLFFLKNAKNLGRSDDGKRWKKEDGLMQKEQISLRVQRKSFLQLAIRANWS